MGRVISQTRADGSATTCAYDAFGRAVSEIQKDASGQSVAHITRTFDGWGREGSSTDALRGVRSESTWSGQTRASHSLGCGETTVTVTTDGSGRETSLEAERGTETASRELARDTAGRVTGLTLDAGTALSQSRAYDTGSGVLSSQEGAGLGPGGIDYKYSAATSRQVREAIDLAYPATSADRDRAFVYDEAGRVVKSTDAGSSDVDFTYTSDGRITSAGGRAFAYRNEPARSQQIASMTENGVTTAFSFDGRGRRTGHSSASESVTYSFDDADRMTGFAKDTGADGTIDVSAVYSYDAAGQRTRSVVTSAGVTTTTEWTYEGLTLLRAESVTGTSTTSVEYVNDAEGRPAGTWVKVPAHATAVFVWLVTDARGDVLELIASEGTPLSYRAYGAYGERIGGASRAAAGLSEAAAEQVDAAITLGYAGYTFDAESGLSYCSQRYYDPATCQWITRDPARADGEESAYQYCGGDPVGAVDPSGLHKSVIGSHSHLWGDRLSLYWGPRHFVRCFWVSRWRRWKDGRLHRLHDHLYYRWFGETRAFLRDVAAVDAAHSALSIGALLLKGKIGKSAFKIATSLGSSAITDIVNTRTDGPDWLRMKVYYRADYWESKSAPQAKDVRVTEGYAPHLMR